MPKSTLWMTNWFRLSAVGLAVTLFWFLCSNDKMSNLSSMGAINLIAYWDYVFMHCIQWSCCSLPFADLALTASTNALPFNWDYGTFYFLKETCRFQGLLGCSHYSTNFSCLFYMIDNAQKLNIGNGKEECDVQYSNFNNE